MTSFLDIIFPPSCSICSRKGTYLCDLCKKLFKRNLPECYKCRIVSTNFLTHQKCKSNNSLDAVFVAWEYNNISSTILKRYKYQYAYDIEKSLSEFFLETFLKTSFSNVLRDSVFVPVPSSNSRFRERGFNQIEIISQKLALRLNSAYSANLIFRTDTGDHQALRSREERLALQSSDFHISEDFLQQGYKSITIVDDVITTGATLEGIAHSLRQIKKNIKIYGVCLFRGRPSYSPEDSLSCTSTSS